MRTRGFVDPYLGAYLHNRLDLPLIALFLAHVLIYIRFRLIRILKRKLLPTFAVLVIGIASFSAAAYINLDYTRPIEITTSPDVETLTTPSVEPTTPEIEKPEPKAIVNIQGIGFIGYDPETVKTLRPDIFKSGHFSVFDVLAHLDEKGEISVDYYFDSSMNTYVVDSINGEPNWWYCAFYDGGWRESNSFRMDHFPYKDKMHIEFLRVHEKDLQKRYDVFNEEVNRLKDNGKVIIPEVSIITPSGVLRFENVAVEPHNLRNDTFQEGVITAIDVVMSLADQGLIEYELKWYDQIGFAEINTYYVERINQDKAFDRCGYVYEEGDLSFKGFIGNHIHIPMDIRVLNSPDYFLIFWICI